MGRNAPTATGTSLNIKVSIGSLPIGRRVKPVVNTSMTVDTGGLQTVTVGATNFTAQIGNLVVTALPVDLAKKDQLLFTNGAVVEVTADTAAAATSLPVRVIRNSAQEKSTGIVIATGETAKIIPLSSPVTNPIGGGTPIEWSGGALTFLGGDVVAGSSILSIVQPASGLTIAVDAAETGTYNALEKVLGNTDAALTPAPNYTDYLYHGDARGVKEGSITSLTETLPINVNFLQDSDYARYILEMANRESVVGREVYYVYETKEKVQEGVAKVSGFSPQTPADGIISASFTLTMQGAPFSEKTKLVDVAS